MIVPARSVRTRHQTVSPSSIPPTAAQGADIGYTARLAFAHALEPGVLERLAAWVETLTGVGELAYAWIDDNSRHRRDRRLERVVELFETGGVDTINIRPYVGDEDLPIEFDVAVSAGRGHNGAPEINWRWTAYGDALAAPIMPPGRHLEEWLDGLREHAIEWNASIGHVGGHDDGSAFVYRSHGTIYYRSKLDQLAGYQWLTVINAGLFDRLMIERRLDDFDWYEASAHQTPTGGTVHWLRATRDPSEMTPHRWSQLRHFFAPLLPKPVQPKPQHQMFTWNCYAPEDIVDYSELLRNAEPRG